MTQVKICGITNLADAVAAIEAGAGLLGFNFYPPSPRSIQPQDCARITSVLARDFPAVRLVGVFVNRPVGEIEAILAGCHLELAQLHGDEDPQTLAALGGRAFKALRGMPEAETCRAFTAANPGAHPALLLDTAAQGLYGGSGQTGDWSAATELARTYPILLAGGIRPENAAAAVSQVRPWGIDCASGVESSPGRKDAQKMKDLLAAVQSSSTRSSQA